MSGKAILNAEGEQEWLRLKQHVEWCDHFALGFIFSNHPGVVRVFRERLADIYKMRVTRLETPKLTNHSDLTQNFLAKLLNPPDYKKLLSAPTWIDLSHQRDQGWPEARLSFLKRLNEQREPLRRALGRPLILILPHSERQRVKKTVPDLWAIRDFSITTDEWIQTTPASIQTMEGSPYSQFQLSDHDHSLLAEWARMVEKNSTDRGVLLAAARALKACLKSGRYPQAEQIALRQEAIARERVAAIGETPESLRDLSVSLDNVGKTAQAMGSWSEAETAFKQGLEIGLSLEKMAGRHEKFRGLPDHFRKRLQELENLSF